jgi:hypothetical protein
MAAKECGPPGRNAAKFPMKFIGRMKSYAAKKFVNFYRLQIDLTF